jgi:putative membrane protein
MELLLKLSHIAFLSIWIAGALYLPQVFVELTRPQGRDAASVLSLARGVYLGVMTASGIAAVLLGTALIFFGFEGGWLPVKLLLVLLLTAFHLYCGRTLLLLEKHRPPHSPAFYRALTFVPLPLLFGIVVLAVAKPF